jgi:hypothetical protein
LFFMRRAILILALVVIPGGGCGTDVAGPSASFHACLLTEPIALDIGQFVSFHGSGNRAVCLSALDDDAAFLYLPFVAGPPAASDEPGPALPIRVLGGGIASPGWQAGAPPGADRLPELRMDPGDHGRIREREIAELQPLLRPGPPDAPAPVARAAPTAPPSVDEVVELNVALSCSDRDTRRARVMAVTDRAVIVAEEALADRLPAAQYAAFGAAFDNLVHPVVTRHFGEATDIDGNGRIIIFFTGMVNGLNPAGSNGVTAGVFWAGDLFPAAATSRLQACPAGNQAELFYLAVPDPMGTLGPPIAAAWLAERAVRVMAHEYQHLINAARRLYVNEAPGFEQVWLNEGLSHVAEELLFFEATGLPRGANLTWSAIESTPGASLAYDRYMAGNRMNLGRFLERPDTTSPMGRDGLATRGATWSLLRYAADRHGQGDEAFFFQLANATRTGLENLDQAVAGAALEWMLDWAIALYTDHLVPGLDPRHTHPSWNLRDIHRIPGGGYPLGPAALGPLTPVDLALLPGGAGFLSFGVAAGDRAAIHVESAGATPPRALRGSFLRLR